MRLVGLCMMAITGLLAVGPSNSADLAEVLNFNGWWRTNISSPQDAIYIRIEIKQNGREVHVIHRDGMATVARGAEIFRGTYQPLSISGQSRNQAGAWVADAMAVDDPDHVRLAGRRYERTTYPPANNPECKPDNPFKVAANFAVSRGYQLNEAKRYEQSNCWYRIAADLGDPAGVQGLGYAYGMGLGVPKDALKSFQLESAAAEHGNLFAQADMVYDYTNGYGVGKDLEKAAAWKRKHDQQVRSLNARHRAAQQEVEDSTAPLRFFANLTARVLGPMGPDLKQMMLKADHRPYISGVWEWRQMRGGGNFTVTRYRIKQNADDVSLTVLSNKPSAPDIEVFRGKFTDNVTIVGRVIAAHAPKDPTDTITLDAPDHMTFAKGGQMRKTGE